MTRAGYRATGSFVGSFRSIADHRALQNDDSTRYSRESGGKKNRYVILSPNLLELLRDWWRVARKEGWMAPGQPWLFPGYRGQHMSACSAKGHAQ